MNLLNSRYRNILIVICLILTGLLTRLPFVFHKLYHWDSVQYALAMEKFDCTKHSPHPMSGSILYIGIAKVLNLIIRNNELSLRLLSLIFSIICSILIFYIAIRLFNYFTGIFASFCFLFSQTVWFYSILAFPYTISTGFNLLLIWLLLLLKNKKGNKNNFLFLVCTVLYGLCFGIRNSSLVFLFPVVIYLIRDFPLKKIVISAIITILIVAIQFSIVIYLSHGYQNYVRSCKWQQQAVKQGFVFKDNLFKPAFNILIPRLVILKNAVYWSFRWTHIFVIAGMLSLLFIKTKKIKHKLFLFLWIAPYALFYVFIYYVRPGYLIPMFPPLFIIAGYFIYIFLKFLIKCFKFRLLVGISIILLGISGLNSRDFIFGDMYIHYQKIKLFEQNLNTLIRFIKQNYSPSNTIIVSIAYFRHLMYYLRNYKILLIRPGNYPFLLGYHGKIKDLKYFKLKQNFNLLICSKKIIKNLKNISKSRFRSRQLNTNMQIFIYKHRRDGILEFKN